MRAVDDLSKSQSLLQTDRRNGLEQEKLTIRVDLLYYYILYLKYKVHASDSSGRFALDKRAQC